MVNTLLPAPHLGFVLDVVNDQRARVHQLWETDQVNVLARIATDSITASECSIGTPALATAIDHITNGLQDDFFKGVCIEAVHEVAVLLVRHQPTMLLK